VWWATSADHGREIVDRAVAIVTLLGCTSDALTAPSGEVDDPEHGRNIAAPSEWRQAAMGERILLGKLAARFAVYRDTADGRRIEQSRALIALLEQDSVSSSEASAAFDPSSSLLHYSDSRRRIRIGASASLSSGNTDIDPFNSFTRFYPPDPNISIQTEVPSGAHWISETSAGQYTKLGQTYGIMQAAYANPIDLTTVCEALLNSGNTSGGDFETLPDGTCLLLRYTLSDFSTLAMDCSKFGIEMNVTTTHRAGVMWPSSIPGAPMQKVETSQLLTTATDNGDCPHVAPTAHFQMSMYGSAPGGDYSWLEADEPGTVDMSALGSERDAPIASYAWTIGLSSRVNGFYASFNAPVGATGVRLDLTDELGKTAFAESAVLVRSPEPLGGGIDRSSGGGYEGPWWNGEYQYYLYCTYWEISYDGGYTWYPDGKTCLQVMP
jgi:hypothetical protein